MARKEDRLLDANDRFPELEFQPLSGQPLKLPLDAGDGYAVILIYRGHW